MYVAKISPLFSFSEHDIFLNCAGKPVKNY